MTPCGSGNYTGPVEWTAEQIHYAAQRRLKKDAQRKAWLEERRAAARAHAKELVQAIVAADPTVRRIWGFGSTFDERLRFRESSDIDLAVEGGSLAAWQTSQRSPWKVDWVELDDQDESMIRSITTSGVVLYER
ncbi:MAG: hypothetical protein ACLFPV_07065 [Spirochaetaceae bacterium]